MIKIRYIFIMLVILFYPIDASAQVSVNIGFNLSRYPHLVVVPGYPVYYAPQLEANFFFYDGMYWVYQNDYWYTSSWYNGPWWPVSSEDVPVFILRIPVRYYRQPPAYFIGWRADAPPRWGDYWGLDWEQHRSGWDRWNRNAAPAPAPLPVYQRQYSRDRYPEQVQQQQRLQQQNYRFHPRDPVVRQYYQERSVQSVPVQQMNPQQQPADRGARQPDIQLLHQQNAPDVPRSQVRKPAPDLSRQEQPQGSRAVQRELPHGQEERPPGKEVTREPKQDQERGRNRND